MRRFVLDTSVVLKWFNQTGEFHVEEAEKILDDLSSEKIEIIIPDVLTLELLNALIKGKGVTLEEANSAIRDVFDMPIKIIGLSLLLLEESSKFMEKHEIAAYDAYFLALAKQENCKLISDDQKAHGKIKDKDILMLEDYSASYS